MLNAESSQCTLILDCLMLFGWIKFHFMGIMGIETLFLRDSKHALSSSPFCTQSKGSLVAASVPSLLLVPQVVLQCKFVSDQGLICRWSVLQPTMCQKAFLLRNVTALEPGGCASQYLPSFPSIFVLFLFVWIWDSVLS